MRLREYQKEYYKANKTKCDQRTYKNRTPEKEMIYKARGRAKKSGLDFNIDITDIHIPTHCPILGIEIRQSSTNMDKHSPTLDRIDNSKGYIKGNVCVISNKANMCKSDLSVQEIEALYKYVLRCP